jgi:hypothetical protein
MQDEVTKHTKKIYNSVKNTEHTFGEKAKEVIIEIFIIVFAVTLSIWLHSWSEHRHQQKEVSEFLADFKEDLKQNIVRLKVSKQRLSQNIKDYQFIYSLTQNKIDSLKKVHGSIEFFSPITLTKFNTGNYEGFKSSGKIGLIENKNLKRQILKYSQEQIVGVNELEKYRSNNFEKIIDYVQNNFDKGISMVLLNNSTLKQNINLHIFTSKGLLGVYEKATEEAESIIKKIDATEK